MRKIVVYNKEYQYRIGKQNVVIRCDGKKFSVVDFSKLTGMSWNDIERGEWERQFHIKPNQVATHIRLVLSECSAVW